MTLSPETMKINPTDGAEMVFVPAGPSIIGSSDDDIAAILRVHPDYDARWFARERPQRTFESPGYWIYRYPVTVAQYRQYCETTDTAMPPEPEWGWQDTHPMVNVSWDEAIHYATWAKVALPTEAQWEKAARGTDGRWWPWGNTWDPANCISAAVASSTKPVGSCPGGASPYGALDMAGNVWEWCHAAPPEEYAPPPPRTPQRRAAGPSGHILRGGSWLCAYDAYLRCSFRCFDCDQQRGFATYRRPTCGFRCMLPE
jgi:formylglycine-generating enzyme required for sulfatase activity